MGNDKTKKAINKLIEEIAGDEKLRKRVRRASIDELMDIAEEKGLDIKRSQLKKAIREQGADIAIGEGQPLGVPMSSGGPYFGFMTTKMKHVRQMPGRIVGRTTDLDGQPGYALTLQAREQHIRRTKATSNICTNQGLMVTAATIYMSLLGYQGLRRVASASVTNTALLVDKLTQIDGVERAFATPSFHETLLVLDRPVAPVLAALAAEGIQGGFDTSETHPDYGNGLLVCATETKTEADIERYADAMARVMAA